MPGARDQRQIPLEGECGRATCAEKPWGDLFEYPFVSDKQQENSTDFLLKNTPSSHLHFLRARLCRTHRQRQPGPKVHGANPKSSVNRV